MRFRKKLFFFIGICISFTFLFLIPKEVSAQEENTPFLEGTKFTNIKQEITLNNKRYVTFSTNKSIYFLKDYEIEFSIDITDVLFLETMVDVNNNGYDEILIMTSSKDIPNIRLYDSNSLELIYSYSPQEPAYHFSMGHFDKIVHVEDYVIDGYVGTFISGYKVFKIDFLKQIVLWEYQANNNLWDIEPIGDINNDQVIDYMVSIEYTDVITISGKTGESIYQIPVSDPVMLKTEEIKTNIWNLQYDNEQKTVYAASENGHIYVIDTETGSVEKSFNVAELNSIYIGYFYYYSDDRQILFKKFQIKLIDDVDGNGVRDVIFYLFGLNKLAILSGEYLQNNIGDLRLTEDKEIYSEEIGVEFQLGTYQNEDVIYFLRYYSDYNYYQIYSLKQDRTIGYVDLYNKNKYHIVSLSNGDLLRFHDRGLSVYDGENDRLLYSITKFTDMELDQDKLLRLEGWYGHTRLRMIDVISNEELWAFNTNSSTNTVTIGGRESRGKLTMYYDEVISYKDYSTDINNDGMKDLVIILSKTGEIPKISVIDGKTGQKLSEQSIVVSQDDIRLMGRMLTDEEYDKLLNDKSYYAYTITQFGKISDLNGDDVEDYYVSTDYGEIYFFDMTTGELITAFTTLFETDDDITFIKAQKANVNFTNFMIVDDLYDDSIDDLIILNNSAFSTYNLFKNQSTLDINHIKTTSFNYDFGYETSNIGDVDGDGLVDLLFNFRVYKNPYSDVLSSKTGDFINQINPIGGLFISDLDLNQDGMKELISLSRVDNKNKINLYDILTNSSIYESNEFFVNFDFRWQNNEKPAIFFKNNDGEINVAIMITNKTRTKSIIQVYDLENQLLNSIDLSVNVVEYDEANRLGNIKSIEQDGKTYLCGKMFNETVKSYIYNITDNKLVMIYDGEVENFSIIDNKLILKDKENQHIFITDYTKHIEIDNIKQNETVNRKLTIEFSNINEGIVNIYVDNYLVGQTNEESYTLTLLEGNHEIKVSQIDKNGVELFYQVNVSVTEELSFNIVLPIVTTFLLVFIFFIAKKNKKYTLPQYKRKGSEEK